MNRETILGALDAHGFAEHKPTVEALMQPSIHVVAAGVAGRPEGWNREHAVDPAAVEAFDAALEALPLGASRFGGLPDLPAGTPWPERDGVPMEFVAQLRLEDVAPLDPLGRLPAGGTLAFFYNSQWTTSDFEPQARCAAVLHTPAGAPLVRMPAPRIEFQSEFSDTPQLAPRIHGLATLTFVPFVTVPGGVSPFVDGALGEVWQDFESTHGDGFQPPGAANRVLGYVGAQDYVDAHVNGTGDQLLLQVDSDGEADFQWGDCDRLYFMMSKAELAAGDFSRVRLYSILG